MFSRMTTRKVFGGALGLIYFVANVVLAHSAESNFWAERRRPAFAGFSQRPSSTASVFSPSIRQRFPAEFRAAHGELLRSFPYAQGSVRQISFPPRFSPQGPVVIHIQDVHQNREAQRHIAEAVAALAGRVDVIGLEGSTRTIDLARFRAFPDRNAIALVAEESLAQNEITGPIHAALTSAESFPALVGIDDPVHYTANIEAYRHSAPHREEQRAALEVLKVSLENEKQATLNPALRAFDQTVNAYHTGGVSLANYVKFLANKTHAHSLNVRHFAEALALENTLDFQAVDRERARVVERLSRRLGAQEMARLTAQGTAYRLGTIRYGEFYGLLKDLCQKNGVALGKPLDTYIRYVLLADNVDAGALFEELLNLERAGYQRLAKSPAEIDLVARSRRVFLTEKLLRFALTPEEWREYATTTTRGLDSFESFYREAHAREGAMAANLLSALSHAERKIPVGVLVTGGYHAPGLTEQLTRAGATVISFVPKIETVDTMDGPVALGIFTREKSPLQKLFEGEILFLGQDPAPTHVTDLSLPFKGALVSEGDPRETFSALAPADTKSFVRWIFKRGPELTLRWKNGSVRGQLDRDAPLGSRITTITESNQTEPIGADWIKEIAVAFSVASAMGLFFFGAGTVFPEIWGTLPPLPTLLLILGTNVLSAFPTFYLFKRWGRIQGNPVKVSFLSFLAVQVLFFGPIYGFVGNEFLRMIPALAPLNAAWTQSLVNQFFVAVLVWDPLGALVFQRVVLKKPFADVIGSMKGSMLGLILLYASMWLFIGALGLSFPNNGATNIIANVLGILAGAVGAWFMAHGENSFLHSLYNLGKDPDKIRFLPLRLFANFLGWFYSRPWFGTYLLSLVAFGYAALGFFIANAVFSSLASSLLVGSVIFVWIMALLRPPRGRALKMIFLGLAFAVGMGTSADLHGKSPPVFENPSWQNSWPYEGALRLEQAGGVPQIQRKPADLQTLIDIASFIRKGA